MKIIDNTSLHLHDDLTWAAGHAVPLEKAVGIPACECLVGQLHNELAGVMRLAREIRVEPFRVSTTESGEQ